MLALGTDKLAVKEEVMLDYAENFFKQMKAYLLDYGRELTRENNPELNINMIRDRDLVEMSLKSKFEDDKSRWPAARWSTFINLVFNDMKILYGNEMESIIEKLQSDLAEKGSYNLINLRTLRN
jgi:alpha-tubulin suppressor-like RCC1 family protein